MTALASTPHPVLACAASIDEALKAVVDVEPVFMCAQEKAAALAELTVLESRLAELRLRVLACSGDVAESTGARDVAAWLAHETRQDRPVTRADAALAVSMDREYAVLARGVREGGVSIDQARVIAKALTDLPEGLDAEVRAKAEEVLVDLAGAHPPADLRRLGRRILACVDPDAADAHEAELLEQAERAAAERTKLTLRSTGDGMTRLSGLIRTAAADRLATYLHAYTNPRKGDGTTSQAGVGSYPRRLGQAFVQLLEAVDPKRLPLHGGDATTVIVTIGLDHLLAEHGLAEVIGGETITASQARRLACMARILPAVLGGKSELLDLGRAQRLFTAAQRKALLVRDQTCRAEGCDIPGTWSEAHHWLPWARGGATTLNNGVLLCHLHHHRVHDLGWHAERLPDGDIRFTRRT